MWALHFLSCQPLHHTCSSILGGAAGRVLFCKQMSRESRDRHLGNLFPSFLTPLASDQSGSRSSDTFLPLPSNGLPVVAEDTAGNKSF